MSEPGTGGLLSHLPGPVGLLAGGAAAVVVGAAITGTVLFSTAAKSSTAVPTITSGPATATTSTGASFTFTGAAGVTFQCQLNTAGFTACTSPKPYSGLSQGTHTFQVKAISGAGESAPASYSWTVDFTAPPAPTFTSRPAAVSNTTSPSFGFADGESGVSYLCKLDSAATFTACSNPQIFGVLSQGSHSLSVEAKDAAGNVGPAASYSWTVDTVSPPAPVITQKPNDPAVGATQTFAFTDTEVGVSFQCAGENGVFAACSSPYTYVVDTNNSGRHQFAVRALDAAGNVSSEASYRFKVTRDTATSGTPFTITGNVSGLVLGQWKSLPLHIPNPNAAPIYVTGLTVSVAADSTPSGCLSSNNVQLQQSNISATVSLVVPANGAVDLPVQGVTAPQIRLQDLPTNQDVCKSKTFTLTYSATANN